MHHRHLIICLLLLCGCAAAPMTTETHANVIASQEAYLRIQERCCSDLNDLVVIPIQSPQKLRVTTETPVTKITGQPSPTNLFELPQNNEGNSIQLFSFTESKSGFFRFDEITFIRPHVVFLDSSKSALRPTYDPSVCWGRYGNSDAGVWSRVEIPTNARFVAIAPSLSPPSQFVDTRMGDASVVVQTIAEARKSYLNLASFGYTGLYDVSIVPTSARPLGRCVKNGP